MKLVSLQAVETLGDLSASSRRKRKHSVVLKSKKSINLPEIDRKEWDFKNNYQEGELELCYKYEFGRNSDIIKKIWKKGLLVKEEDGIKWRYGKGKNPIMYDQTLPKFIWNISTFGFEFPNQPWSTICKDKIEELLNKRKNSGKNINKLLEDAYVSPIKTKQWAVKLKQFLDAPVLLPPDGRGRWVIAIDWSEKDSVLRQMFKEWLQSNPRPEDYPAPKDSGRKSYFQDSLNALGALRLLKHFKNSERAVQEIQRYASEVKPVYKRVYKDERSLRRAAKKAEKILEEQFGQIKSK